MAELVAIPADRLAAHWPRIAAQVEELAGISYGRLTGRDICRAVRERDMQLWAATEGEHISVMTTQILNFPQLRECRIVSAHGQNADRWLPLWPLFEKWALENGCAIVAAECRPGWKKLLAPLGFTETRLVLEKTL